MRSPSRNRRRRGSSSRAPPSKADASPSSTAAGGNRTKPNSGRSTSQVSDLNTLPNEEGNQRLVVQTRFGGHLEWTGKMTVRPFTASGHISLAGEKLSKISAYLPAELLAFIDDGTLDAAFDYSVVGNNEGRATGGDRKPETGCPKSRHRAA